VAELSAEERTTNASSHEDCSGGACGNGEIPDSCSMNREGVKQRPISMIGVGDMFSADAEEKDRLPAVSLQSLNQIETHI